jgi:monoamine oxidase
MLFVAGVTPRALAATGIRYGCPVARADQDKPACELLHAKRGAKRFGDYAICHSFSVLRASKFRPQVTRKAVYYSAVGKHVGCASVPPNPATFWLDEGLSGAATTDLPVMGTYEKNFYQPGTRGMLEVYIAGERARKLAAMNADDRFNFTVNQTQMIHPAIREHLEGGSSVCWDEEQWSRGAYAWFRPGEMTTMLRHIATPEGRIHFAAITLSLRRANGAPIGQSRCG